MSSTSSELITCNRCNHRWHTAKAQTCPECGSYNIEIGKGRPKDKMGRIITVFKPGDWVRFCGLKYGDKEFFPHVGKLKAKHNCAPGCVEIEGHDLRLIFNPDGTLYCHAQFGILLQKYKQLPRGDTNGTSKKPVRSTKQVGKTRRPSSKKPKRK